LIPGIAASTALTRNDQILAELYSIMAPPTPTTSLNELRKRIDEIDQKLVHLINDRANVVVQIGKTKLQSGTPIYAPHREAAVLAKVQNFNQGPTLPKTIEAIYREIMSGSFALEQPIRIGFLGPPGTYSHLAATRHFGSSVDFEDLHAITGVFEEVAREHVEYGLVPIENSTGGSITETLDAFMQYHLDVRLYGELQLGVHCCLLTDCQPNEVKRIYGRPESFAQCRSWLATQYPQAELIAVESSAGGARRAKEEFQADPESGRAAIGGPLAGEIYGLHPLFEQIEDRRNNVTRFLIISKQETEPSGDDKTSLMFTTLDQAGALSDVLSVFKRAEVNLTHIDKCPTRGSNWEYTFFVDAVGHRLEPKFAELIGEVRAFSKQLTVLGSYPRSKQVL